MINKNTDNDKYGYSGYVFDFIHVQPFRYQFMELVKMLLLFVQTTLYQHMFKYQSLEKVRLMSWTITSEKEYGLHITERGKKTCLSLHHNIESAFLVRLWCKNLSIQSKRSNE